MKKVFFINPELFIECDAAHESTIPCTFHTYNGKIDGSICFIGKEGNDIQIGIKSAKMMLSMEQFNDATQYLVNCKQELKLVLISAFRHGFFEAQF